MATAANPAPEVMTLPEAANYLRVSERTLWAQAQAGEVPHCRVGAQYRFSKSQLQRWMEEQALETARVRAGKVDEGHGS